MYELLNNNKDLKRDFSSHCSKSFPSQTIVHPKLEMTNVGDPDEQEADNIANEITNGNVIKRQISSGNNNSGITLPHNMESVLNAMQGGGQKMPQELQSMMEHGFNHDFSNVRIHTDASASEMSGNIHAKAFTHGNDIYFNQGQFNPETQEGQRLVAHELTHVVQAGNKIARDPTKDDSLWNWREPATIEEKEMWVLIDLISDLDAVVSGVLAYRDFKHPEVVKLVKELDGSIKDIRDELQKVIKERGNTPVRRGVDYFDTLVSIYSIVCGIEKVHNDIVMISRDNNEYYAQLFIDLLTLFADIVTIPKLEEELVRFPYLVAFAEAWSAGVYLGDFINKTTGADKFMADVVFPLFNELLLKHDIHWLDYSNN